MRPRAQKLILIAQVLLLIMILMPRSASATQTATLSVNPSSGVMTYPSYAINIMISPVTNLNSIHFKLSFNNGTQDFLEVRMGDVKLGAVFTGQQLNFSTGIYHLTDTGLSYVDVLIDLYNNNTVNIAGTQSIASITFHLLANAMPGMTSWLKLESADAVFYVGGSKPFDYIDEKNGMTLQSGAVRVDYLVTTLTMNAVTATVEKPATISSTLKDGDGNPINATPIHYYVNSQEISGSPVTTDSGGISSISYTPSDVGTFTIKAEYVGNQPNGKYAGSSTTASLTVNKRNTTLSLSVPASITVGETVNLAATLKKDDGTPLIGETIKFSVNSTVLGSPTTNASGIASIQYTFPSSPGTHVIKAEYAETAKYAGSIDTTTRKTAIYKTSLRLTITPPTNLKVDQTITLSATLKDQSNTPLQSKKIDYYIDSQPVGSALTNSNGVSSITYSPSEASPSDGWEVEAQYAGDGPYSSSVDTVIIVVNKLATTLTLTVTPTTIAFGQTIIMTAILKDENTKAVPNSNIDYYIKVGQWTKVGSKTTDGNGVAPLDYILTTTGTLLVKANYTGSSKYFGAEYIDQDIITVLKLNTTLALSMPTTAKVEQTITILATLEDQNQQPIPDVTIEYDLLTGVLEQPIGSAKTDQTGVASLPYNLTSAGTFQIRATYKENMQYQGISESKTLTVNPLTTTLTINTPTTARVGDTVTLLAILKDENEKAIAGVAIKYSIYLGGAWTQFGLTPGTTNSSGVSTMDYTPYEAGTFRIRAEFGGDSQHSAVYSQEATLTVRKVQTTLTISILNTTATSQSSVKISATLKDEDGQPISQANIIYQILKNGNWTNIGSAITNSQGVASMNYQPNEAGTFRTRAVYSGETRYAGSTSEEANLEVTGGNPFDFLSFLFSNKLTVLDILFWGVIILGFSTLVVGLIWRKVKSSQKQASANVPPNRLAVMILHKCSRPVRQTLTVYRF
jgi:hypothetical protein